MALVVNSVKFLTSIFIDCTFCDLWKLKNSLFPCRINNESLSFVLVHFLRLSPPDALCPVRARRRNSCLTRFDAAKFWVIVFEPARKSFGKRREAWSISHFALRVPRRRFIKNFAPRSEEERRNAARRREMQEKAWFIFLNNRAEGKQQWM